MSVPPRRKSSWRPHTLIHTLIPSLSYSPSHMTSRPFSEERAQRRRFGGRRRASRASKEGGWHLTFLNRAGALERVRGRVEGHEAGGKQGQRLKQGSRWRWYTDVPVERPLS